MADQNTVAVIQYVNERDGRRPPSIKADGRYYTISDAALNTVEQYKGQEVDLTYFVNGGGYHVAVAINGRDLPKDDRNARGNRGRDNRDSRDSRDTRRGNEPQRTQSAPAVSTAALQKAIVFGAKIVAYTNIEIAAAENGWDDEQVEMLKGNVKKALSSGGDNEGDSLDARRRQEEREAAERARRQQEEDDRRQRDLDDFDDDIPF